MKKYYLILLFTCTYLTDVQARQLKDKDNLFIKDYAFFETQIKNKKRDTVSALVYANAWLSKAKKEQNALQTVNAYKNIMHLVEKKFRMIYADSLLNTALASKDNAIIGGAYLSIGAAHYTDRDWVKALDNYLYANHYISKTQDKYLIHKVKYTIAQTKYFLGYYHEAITLFSECIAFFKIENETAYLKSLHSIGLCYIQIERYDLCTFNNQLGIKLSQEFDDLDMIPYFNKSEGINQYKLKNYPQAIHLLKKSRPEIESKKDDINQMIISFYLGKCFWETNDKTKGLAHFLQVNHAIEKHKIIRPDLRENFELLIGYFEETKNLKEQLFFIEKLLEYDKKLIKDFKYLSYKIHKEYDTKSLLLKKQQIKEELAFNKKILSITSIFLSMIILFTVSFHVYSKKKEKKKFNTIIEEFTKSKQPSATKHGPITTISPELTDTLLQNLQKFEENKKYLEKEMNLTKLAGILNTNTKYVSKIIAKHRGKKTINYINDLKIDHIVELLINNNKYRNYTNKALADEAGFGSTQIFTKTFKNKIGMSPTSFIDHIKNARDSKQ